MEYVRFKLQNTLILVGHYQYGNHLSSPISNPVLISTWTILYPYLCQKRPATTLWWCHLLHQLFWALSKTGKNVSIITWWHLAPVTAPMNTGSIYRSVKHKHHNKYGRTSDDYLLCKPTELPVIFILPVFHFIKIFIAFH